MRILKRGGNLLEIVYIVDNLSELGRRRRALKVRREGEYLLYLSGV